MAQVTCPGLPASWINGWLAAVGTTVLDSRIRLHWTAESTPAAVFSCRKEQVDPLAVIVASWPDEELLADLPIAEHRAKKAGRLRRKVSVEDFVARAQAVRRHPHSWALSSTMTDLCVDQNGEVAHAPFDPAGPGTIKWLHHRLTKVHAQVEPPGECIEDSFAGRGARVQDNGLGFDLTRLGSQSDASDPWVDPVVEVLAFLGLAILPVRGAGIDRRQNRQAACEIQKGWTTTGPGGARRFLWPAWSQPLDLAGIDALMDAWNPDRKAEWPTMGVHAGWQSVQFERRSQADTTRAFGAERL